MQNENKLNTFSINQEQGKNYSKTGTRRLRRTDFVLVSARAVGLETGLGLETNFLWSWSRLFCTGLGLGLEPLWSWSRSSKIGLETG